jgi:hypothetical protein
VAALVYIAAFLLDRAEPVNTLISGFPRDGSQSPILPPTGGFLFLDRAKFHDSFAGDVPTGQAAFKADWNASLARGSSSSRPPPDLRPSHPARYAPAGTAARLAKLRFSIQRRARP